VPPWRRAVATALLALGAAGPQWGREAVRRQSQGSDVVFVVDVSLSMDTRDVPPSRMEETRRETVALLERLQGSRVGVVAFAGDAVRLCPLTLDQTAVRLTLETLESGAVSEPGSDLGRALRAGIKLLPAGRRDEQAMVLWTDGEDLEGHARDAIEELRRSGLRVFVVGVGTPAGDVIPLSDISGVTVDVKRDENNQVVRSRLDEGLLRDIARASRGEYFSAARSGGELVRIARSLGSLARSRKGTRPVEQPVARFPAVRAAGGRLPCGPVRHAAASHHQAFGLAARVHEAWAARARRRGARAGRRHRAEARWRCLCSLDRTERLRAATPRLKRKEWARAESSYVRRARQPPPSGLLANLGSRARAPAARG
jgi:Ca-activated chloride channel family protein